MPDKNCTMPPITFPVSPFGNYPIIDVEICNRTIKALVDTGATTSSIDMELAKQLTLNAVGETEYLSHGNTTQKAKVVEAVISIRIFLISSQFIVAPFYDHNFQMLIGCDILKHFKVVYTGNEISLERMEKR